MVSNSNNSHSPSNPQGADGAVYTVTSHNDDLSPKAAYCQSTSNTSESSSISYTTNRNDGSRSGGGPCRSSIGHLLLFFLVFNALYGLIITPFLCIKGLLSSSTRRQQVSKLILHLAKYHGILCVDLSCLTTLDLEAGGGGPKHKHHKSTTHQSWDWQTYTAFASSPVCQDPLKAQATIEHLQECVGNIPTAFKLSLACLFFIPLASIIFFLLGLFGLIIWTFELLLDDDDPSTVIFLWTWWKKCVKLVS